MNKQLTEKERLHIIGLTKKNYTIIVIADIYDISTRTVERIINKFNNDNNLNRKKGSGRLVTYNIDSILINLLEVDRYLTLTQLESILKNRYDINCSRSNIHKIIIKLDYLKKLPNTKPLLTLKHLERRYYWAILYKNCIWTDVIWSDETCICIQSNCYSKVWVHKDTEVIKRIVKYPLKIHIWGCILKNRKLIIHIYDKSINTERYVEMMQLILLPILKTTKRDLLYQQDNAPPHTSKITTRFFVDNNINVMYWPPNSPDLNPIENIWYILKNKIGKINVKTKDELKNIIIKCADEIEVKTINKLIKSMDNRIIELINNKYDSIDY